MDRRWAVNASPLIFLGKLDLLHLLPALASSLIIPAQVIREVNEAKRDDALGRWVNDKALPHITSVIVNPEILRWNLGVGESAVLSWCIEHKDFEAILDDRAARECASTFGIRLRGTLGILLLAKSQGVIPLVKPDVQKLLSFGFRISGETLRQVYELAGETD